ncbi:hypothetical protein [Undibacterium griseum]|uniref:Uncharacterized protein n=1 Tax=Undibacterium griseum TaxID=2762295 RepID=A0ABR6YR04_9BURK|nr:hypothetical protein [Undibacterium griseum]MBC3886322.1 hypothetical protein [Undibacterium griseum]
MSNLNSTVSTSLYPSSVMTAGLIDIVTSLDAGLPTLKMLENAVMLSTDSIVTFCMLDVTPESRTEALDDLTHAEALDAEIKAAIGMDSPRR